jgi:hypothetical protein
VGPRSRRESTRRTRQERTEMSGLSSGTVSCGGDGTRFLRGGGEGDRCFLSKNDRMVPFFFFFFFWGDAFVAFEGEAWTGISSSVAGGVERSESEDMFKGGWWWSLRGAAGARDKRRGSNKQMR